MKDLIDYLDRRLTNGEYSIKDLTKLYRSMPAHFRSSISHDIFLEMIEESGFVRKGKMFLRVYKFGDSAIRKAAKMKRKSDPVLFREVYDRFHSQHYDHVSSDGRLVRRSSTDNKDELAHFLLGVIALHPVVDHEASWSEMAVQGFAEQVKGISDSIPDSDRWLEKAPSQEYFRLLEQCYKEALDQDSYNLMRIIDLDMVDGTLGVSIAFDKKVRKNVESELEKVVGMPVDAIAYRKALFKIESIITRLEILRDKDMLLLTVTST